MRRRHAHLCVLPDQLPHSPVFCNCADVEQTDRELTGRGVEFPRSGSGTERSDEFVLLRTGSSM